MNEEAIREEELIVAEREADAIRLGAAILKEPIRAMATLKPALLVAPSASIRSVIERMNDNRVGCVLVEDQGNLRGIFTERDVLTKIVGTTVDIDRTAVADVMTRDPESLGTDDKVCFALNKMSVGGFRHIPLVDRSGHPVGIVSMRNVIEYMVDLLGADVLTLPPSPEHIARTREGA
jgi:CBS domain-containing protein